ncbi:MAG: hypothetical protein JWL85_1034 [Candidatus Saccharibacteria bacterium]|nr:hypothetical protein [Candidatus Saccharibacteria bacterium]
MPESSQEVKRLYIVMDVDNTIWSPHTQGPRPGIELLLRSLHVIADINLWSGASRETHSKEVAAMLGLTQYIAAFHKKPPYPMQEEAAFEVLGRRPDLQVDDDIAERVAGWPFMWMKPYWGVVGIDR